MLYVLIPLLPLLAFVVLGLFGHHIKERAHFVAVPAVSQVGHALLHRALVAVLARRVILPGGPVCLDRHRYSHGVFWGRGVHREPVSNRLDPGCLHGTLRGLRNPRRCPGSWYPTPALTQFGLHRQELL